MLLVIFGAGASYDSSADVAGRPRSLPPPLAKDLVGRHFDPFTGHLQLSRPIIALLRRAMDGDDPTSLETELARISAEAVGSAEIRRQLMAFRFYLHAIIQHTVDDWLTYTQGFTYYLDLLNYIFAWQRVTKAPVRLVTFNYDVLLDTAVSNVLDHTFASIPDYTARRDLQVLKLHGSTTWARVFPTDLPNGTSTIRAAMQMAADNLLTDGEILVRPISDQVSSRQRQPQDKPSEVGIPALAVPMEGKTEFECPDEQVAALEDELPKVTHVLIVGWRAAEPHAVRLLDGSGPQRGLMPGYSLGIVSGSQEGAAQVVLNLDRVARKGRLTFVEPAGFSTFIENLDKHMADLLGPNLIATQPHDKEG
jgi:hypothetical protein